MDAFSITRTVSLVSLCLKQNNSLVKQNIFTACFISGTTNRQKFGGSGGIPTNNFSQRICTNWKNSPKQNWEATFPSCLPWRRHWRRPLKTNKTRSVMKLKHNKPHCKQAIRFVTRNYAILSQVSLPGTIFP